MPSTPRKERQPRERQPTGKQSKYNTAVWRKASTRQRWQQPLCEACLAAGVLTDVTPGKHKGATDHIIQLSQGGAFIDGRNLLSLCARGNGRNHHEKKSMLESLGMNIPYVLNEQGEKIPTKAGRQQVIEALAAL